MTQEQLIAWATSKNWTPDRFGHLKKVFRGRTHRLKLSRVAVRWEISTTAGWVRVQSGYYSALTITEDGKLSGMER
jgi:hypothetical protein